jgi:hypothetical protein
VRRLAPTIIVALLTFSVSGVSTLLLSEPCTGDEQSGRADGTCPPTCVTCGCCAQAVEPASVVVASSPDIPVAEIVTALPRLVKSDPRPVLHVPKARS